MRYVCLLPLIPAALILPSLYAQDGAAIYKMRCASCHDAPAGHTPGIAVIKAMTGEAVYVVLSSGAMKSQADGLSTGDLFALIGYIAPTGGTQPDSPAEFAPTCKGDSAFHVAANSPQWNGWSPNVTNSRFEDAVSAGLTAADVP